jgi:hypothetical protein
VPTQMPRSRRQMARTIKTSSGGRRCGWLRDREVFRLAGRRFRAGAGRPALRLPERARDRPPLVVVGTHPTVTRRTARCGH